MAQEEQSKVVNWECLGAELVYTQDRFGKYLSFHWQQAKKYGIEIKTIQGKICQEIFTPHALETYLEILNQVLDRQVTQQCQWQFQYKEQYFSFQLIINPLIGVGGKGDTVLTMGYLLKESQFTNLSSYSLLSVSPEPYQEMLSQIISKIRKTLNLDTIWQETVNSLGKNLKVSRCLLIYCDMQNQRLEVKAEFCQTSIPSILGQRFSLDSKPYWQQAMSGKEPIFVEEIDLNSSQKKSLLILSTFYQDQRNGIICLEQHDYCRKWSQIEIDLLHRLGEQVGTAIAHATFYKELEKVSKYKSDFIANTSHELRTPLHVIINSSQLILENVITDPVKQREFLEKIYQHSRHLLRLIDELLDIHKIESGKMQLDFKSVSLNTIMEDVDNMMRHQAESKGLIFKIKYPSTYEEVVLYTNYQSLLRIMLNLISNAIKFTAQGGVYIIADVISKKVEFQDYQFPGMVKISVADTGIGVPLNKQDELFEYFFQVDNSLTRSHPGTGIGLAISKTLVKALGGTISFYSMGEDLGSTVTFTVLLNHLPLIKTVKTESPEVNGYI